MDDFFEEHRSCPPAQILKARAEHLTAAAKHRDERAKVLREEALAYETKAVAMRRDAAELLAAADRLEKAPAVSFDDPAAWGPGRTKDGKIAYEFLGKP
jgi:hypothetical protein